VVVVASLAIETQTLTWGLDPMPAFAQKGRLDDAMEQFQKALQIKPDDADAQDNLAKAQAMRRQKADPP